jgi:predicted nucleic acid-binding protein
MLIPDVFLDTSTLFSGIWSATGGARMLLKLGEASAVKLYVGSQVLTEIESVLRRKSPHSLGSLALLLNRSQINVCPQPPAKRIAECHSLVNYSADAIVMAAAWEAGVDYFVTLDRKHFLNNVNLSNATPFEIGTPGSCLAWYRSQLASR